ncbi:MAG TPA: hypothetical protein VF490_00760, partial [Chryseosolibacter sp.]
MSEVVSGDRVIWGYKYCWHLVFKSAVLTVHGICDRQKPFLSSKSPKFDFYDNRSYQTNDPRMGNQK